MQPLQDLSALLRAYVQQQSDAFTVAAWVQLTETIADAQFLLASPTGAALFGFLPEELVGQYASQRYPPEDYRKALKLGNARRLGMPVPQSYPSRILTRNGVVRPVIKRVHMTNLAATTVWITSLLPAREVLPVPNIDIGSLENADADQEYFTKYISVAEAALVLADIAPHDPRTLAGHETRGLQLHLPYSQYTDMSMIKDGTHPPEGLFLTPGATVRLPQGRKGATKRPFLHWCQVCNETSRSGDPDPTHCPRRACRSPNWRVGKLRQNIR